MLTVRILTVLALLCSCCAQAAEPGSFPVTLRGTTLTISSESDRATLAAQLSGALAGEEPSVLTVERLGFIALHELVELRRDDRVFARESEGIRGVEIILKAKVLVQNVRVALFDRCGVVRRLSKRV